MVYVNATITLNALGKAAKLSDTSNFGVIANFLNDRR